MTAPLVSVMIPAFNAASTLPVALASLLAQTYQNWECIVVDDGSTDSTSELMFNVVTRDKRFKFICLGENFGRAVARQNALDNAQGQYLAMIDADDWIYPSKLEQQVHILETHSELALVSCGMAIVDSENNLLGIRAERLEFLTYEPLNAPCLIPVAHASSMIRLSIAKSVGYDRQLYQTEDTEFLLRILMKYPFAVAGKPQYVYAEHAHSVDINVIVRSHIDLLKIYSKYFRKFPLETGLLSYVSGITNYHRQPGLMCGADKQHFQTTRSFNQHPGWLVRSESAYGFPGTFGCVLNREIVPAGAYVNIELSLACIDTNIYFSVIVLVHGISYSNLRYGLEALMTIRVMPSESCSVPTCHRSL